MVTWVLCGIQDLEVGQSHACLSDDAEAFMLKSGQIRCLRTYRLKYGRGYNCGAYEEFEACVDSLVKVFESKMSWQGRMHEPQGTARSMSLNSKPSDRKLLLIKQGP